ncbi:MAG: hypothetical protein NTX75_02880 [Proteobacteria bacterium]|nr:hypothetical protein [Pseudomonadota bacterium]
MMKLTNRFDDIIQRRKSIGNFRIFGQGAASTEKDKREKPAGLTIHSPSRRDKR